LPIVLADEASIRVRCTMGPEAVPPWRFLVQLQYGGEGERPDWNCYPKGVRWDRVLLTEADGELLIGGLQPGHWDVWAPKWFSLKPSEHTAVYVSAGEELAVNLVCEGRASERCASGVIRPAPWPADLGECDGVHLEDEEGRAHVLYEGGRFFLPVPNGATRVGFRVVDRDSGLQSQLLYAVAGVHDHNLRIEELR